MNIWLSMIAIPSSDPLAHFPAQFIPFSKISKMISVQSVAKRKRKEKKKSWTQGQNHWHKINGISSRPSIVQKWNRSGSRDTSASMLHHSPVNPQDSFLHCTHNTICFITWLLSPTDHLLESSPVHNPAPHSSTPPSVFHVSLSSVLSICYQPCLSACSLPVCNLDWFQLRQLTLACPDHVCSHLFVFKLIFFFFGERRLISIKTIWTICISAWLCAWVHFQAWNVTFVMSFATRVRSIVIRMLIFTLLITKSHSVCIV